MHHSTFQIRHLLILALVLLAACSGQGPQKQASKGPGSEGTKKESLEPISENKPCDAESLALADDLVKEGGQAHGVGAYRQEFELVSKAVEICPNHFRAHFMRGMAGFKLGYRKEPCDDFKTALKLAEKGPSYAEDIKFIYHMQDQCRQIGFWDDTPQDSTASSQSPQDTCFNNPNPTCLLAIAETMAATIQILGWRNTTRSIIESARQNQLPGPRQVIVPPSQIPNSLKRARAIPDDMNRAFTLRNLAWSQAAAGDISGAIATVKSITGKRAWGDDPSIPWRAETLAGIAVILANPGVPPAKMWKDDR